ncbi:MAG: hypothetical protein AAFZ65_13815 [Planctomycetota bacterium]
MSRPTTNLPPQWFSIAGRLAVAAGAGAALVSLLQDAPPSQAALRGAIAWFVVRLYCRYSARFLAWRMRVDRREEGAPERSPMS